MPTGQGKGQGKGQEQRQGKLGGGRQNLSNANSAGAVKTAANTGSARSPKVSPPSYRTTGELLQKLINHTETSSSVPPRQQKSVRSIEKMLVYYGEDSPTLTDLQERTNEAGLADSTEYAYFNETLKRYQTKIDELTKRQSAPADSEVVKLEKDILAVYKPLKKAEKVLEEAIFKAFEAKQAEIDARLTKGELLTAIMENKVPEEIAERNDEVISEIRKALKPYLNEKDYLKEIDDKMESVELNKNVPSW